MGSFEISRAGIYPKYPDETVLFPVYTTRQRNFALNVSGVIFTCKYFKFCLNTSGLSQSHFRNLSACSIIIFIIIVVALVLFPPSRKVLLLWIKSLWEWVTTSYQRSCFLTEPIQNLLNDTCSCNAVF